MTKSKKPVVIITGVSSGIGLETAKLFSSRGWLVVGTVRSRKYSEELAAHAVDVQTAEMSRPADLKRVVERTNQTYGRVDCVVANAGYGLWGAVASLNYAQMLDQMAVNVVSVAELTRLVLPIMLGQKKGSIVAVSSVAGRVGVAEAPVYSASKFALEGLMESLWYDLTPRGIRVRLIEPGPVKSGFWEHRRRGISLEAGKSAKSVLDKVYEGKSAGSVSAVAEQIYASSMSQSSKLRYPIGVAKVVVVIRKYVPEWLFGRLMLVYYKGRL